MWFDLDGVGTEFCDASRFRFHNEAVLDVDKERAFDIFADGPGMERWLEDFVACRWTSEEPHGVGSTRVVELKMLSVKERFLVWDRGERITFLVYAITMPLTKKFVEDLRFVEMGPKKTRVEWSVHYEPNWFVRPVHPIVRSVFGGIFERSARRLSKMT